MELLAWVSLRSVWPWMWQCLAVRWGEIEYARAGEHHIAFREVVGDGGGDLEIVMVNGAFFPMESLADDPIAHRLVQGLANLGRLVMFDRRGVALSDPVSDWETPLLEQWSDDLAAVIAAAGCDRPSVFSWHGLGAARACAIRHPELIDRLVLYNPASEETEQDSGWVAEFVDGIQRMRAGGGDSRNDKHTLFMSRRHDPAFKLWLDAAGRAGASPTQASRLDKANVEPRPDNALVRTPTLVITRAPIDYVIPAEFYQRAAHQIPDAELVVLPPGDVPVFGLGVDDVLAEISLYLVGEVRIPAPERQIAVIMFTDLVGSTRRAAAAGDAEWKRLLDRHDAVSRREVSRRGGEVIKTTGDGILALLPSATAAIEAAHAIRAELDHDALQVRVGIHIGEIDRRGDDVSGLAVNTAARIMSVADAGQILTSTVVMLITNAASFTSIGPQPLKDIEGTWELHSVDAGPHT
jgi:class 3 adenylate cyclase/pimeloyl-ACP methyl ester carboxylesterase